MAFSISNTLAKLTRQGYPNSRAFTYPNGGIWERLHRALSQSEARAWEDARSTLDSIIPDNSNFTADDATTLEAVYGIYSTSGVSLADRKLAILQKMAYPGTTAPRCNYQYIEDQLRAAGFDVYVYENRFFPGPVTKTPAEILGTTAGLAMLGTFELGEVELAETWADDGITLCVNHIEESTDALFGIPPTNYRTTFYISGSPITTFASVSIDRKDEFRQLILQLKPAQTAAFLFVNYI